MNVSDLEYRADRALLVPPGGADLHTRDMTATFSADVTLADAQTRLGEIGQWLPIDGDASWTLGQLVETNSTGPLRLGYGAWRDLLLGCQFHNGRGELITAGGRTVKNVAGYDLTKFMVGQGGQFGRVQTITTRTYLRPEGGMLAKFAPDARQVNRLLITPCRPQWTVLTPEALWCGYLGDTRTLDFYRTALPAHQPLELTGQALAENSTRRAQLWQSAGSDGSFRAAVPPMNIMDFAATAGLTDWSADAAFGVVIGMAPTEKHPAIQAAATNAGGSVYFIDNGQTTTHMEPGVQQLIARLKIAFDPQGRLA